MRHSRLGPVPPASTPTIHKVMVSNRGKDTRLELTLRCALKTAGVRDFKTNHPVDRIKVDIAFPSVKVAVLVNGCYWHHCPVCDLPLPKTHSDFWAKKFRLTRRRDARVRRSIRKAGWKLVELWEHQIREDLPDCVRLVATTAQGRKVS